MFGLRKASAEIDLVWGLKAQCGMNAFRVIEVDVPLNTEAQLRQTDVLIDFDILILERPPEAFHFGVIEAAAPSVHTDLDVVIAEFADKLRAGELTALI
ncbi:hypothetical protein SDC9_132984 [bioreactor metagenome]|uniref:Uncharacterized protein n=1 Tax=bioreactor metagenome TaxID=1076179 RepID=A0A645D9E5_9ZZZZ